MHIYFSGIGGVGLGPLAEIALDAGYQVSGSDIAESPITKQLEARGAKVNIGQDASYLAKVQTDQPIDWLVYTSALPRNHPELEFASRHKIRVSKRDELLAKIIKDKNLKLIAIAGTHGKTTTTAMLVWLFKKLGLPVSYSIGSTISFGPSGKFDSASQYFIYECDEFDRNFLHFHPELSIITNIDYDHSDTYATKKDYQEAFGQFMSQSQSVIRQPYANIAKSIKLAGQHNRQNGALAIQAVHQITNQPMEKVAQTLNSFPGSARRFEKLADNLYSDYGHHPAEIAATLQMAHELSNHVALVYQPHQNIRQHEIKDQYIDCMAQAEMIYWLPTYLSREDPDLPILKPKELIKNLTNYEAVELADLDDELWRHIQAERKAGTLVLAMGAGSIDDWLRQHLVAEHSKNK